MEVLSSRLLLCPNDWERSFRFYSQTLGLHIYREWGEGPGRGVVFFAGSGFLELSRQCPEAKGDHLALWLQVRDLDSAHDDLRAKGVDIVEAPVMKPWGLYELRVHDPDGILIVIVQVPDDHPLRRRVD